MGNKISKIIDKMRNSPSSISFNEVRDVLVYLGYELSNNGGQHMIFRKPGHEHINIPFAKPIKKKYVKKVLENYEEETIDQYYKQRLSETIFL